MHNRERVRKEVKAVLDTSATAAATCRALDPANRIQTYPESQSSRQLSQNLFNFTWWEGKTTAFQSRTHVQQIGWENESADLN